jgi:hypothetical protein
MMRNGDRLMAKAKSVPVLDYKQVAADIRAFAERSAWRNGYDTKERAVGRDSYLYGYMYSSLESALREMNQAQLRRFKLYNS